MSVVSYLFQRTGMKFVSGGASYKRRRNNWTRFAMASLRSRPRLPTRNMRGLSERVAAVLRRPKREGKVLGRKRIIRGREKIRTMHANGQSVRVIAAKLGIFKV